jgi:hypothetical protein
MKSSNSVPLIDAIWITLAAIENVSEFSPDDPAVKNLKSILLRRISELEEQERPALTVGPKASELMA